MATTIYESQYKDQPAVSLESEAVRVQFLPGIGAKMASLVYKPRDFELMVQAPGAEYLMQPFDGDYVSGECTGFDDMFPTIDLCYYDRFPWQGTKMADHGEVWSLPWQHEVDGERLHFAVYGVRFPYKLEKWVSFQTDTILHLDYRLTNLSPFDFDFVWAAHMMINIEEGTELVLPDGVQSIIGTFDHRCRIWRLWGRVRLAGWHAARWHAQGFSGPGAQVGQGGLQVLCEGQHARGLVRAQVPRGLISPWPYPSRRIACPIWASCPTRAAGGTTTTSFWSRVRPRSTGPTSLAIAARLSTLAGRGHLRVAHGYRSRRGG